MKDISFRLFFIVTGLFFAGMFMLCSCEDEESFTVDVNSLLSFSCDTVDFDTVLVGIGSSTQRFKVYNKNDKGLIISNVSLASDGHSGFRVNVNGQSGTDFHNMEIYDNDSMFVFVELTAKTQNSDLPVIIEDSLVFTLQSGKIQSVVLTARAQNVNLLKGEIITENRFFDADKPYLIYDSLVVGPEALLELNAGATLMFHSNADLIVRGQLICKGTIDNPVVFRGARTDKMLPYLPYDRLDAQWGGIRIMPESFGNVFESVDIHGGSYGIECSLAGIEYYKLQMHNSKVHNVSADALRLDYCAGRFVNCEFSNAGGNCVTLIGGYNEFAHCTLTQFYPWSAEHGSALYFCNVKNDTIYPLEKAEFYNCFITGSGEDEIFGSRIEDDKVAFNCKFTGCAVNTDIEGEPNKSYFVDCVAENAENNAFKSNNFICVDNDNYVYDFRLDSLSVARGVGIGHLPDDCVFDKNGVERPTLKPDAGCYQYLTTINE